ncbi:MAG: HIRAN domain-containing protein [Actinomycetota bacterium]|nr:HIRAN domain-containing protein [Actinomycetota bacterium]
MRPGALSGRRLTASRGLVAELRLEWFEAPWSHGDGATRGYRVVDERGGAWSDADLDDSGVHVLRVAGASHRADALQADGFAPGEPVILMPESDNPHDPFALAVLDLSLAWQAGYVPATRSRELVEEMRHRALHALVLAEHRAGGRRVGLRVAGT